jgi:flavin reductase (DIM6/NTAB) family NADH-FMN oxidoreductase RutF
MNVKSRGFRDALGHFATGVAIITARNPAAEPFGITINSFASVSLDPPLILWSLDRGSDRFAMLSDVTHFGVNVLASGDRGLSQRFSRKGEHLLPPELVRDGSHGVPLILSAMATFSCSTEHRYDGGDHIILVGRVLEHSHSSHDLPLVYYRGAYRDISPAG